MSELLVNTIKKADGTGSLTVPAESGTVVVKDGSNDVTLNDITATGVYLGGTGAANYLDDYEEGTWTPVLGGDTSTSGQSYSRQDGHYTKIGNYVFANFELALSNKGTISGNLRILGLPFNADTPSTAQSGSILFGKISAFSSISDQFLDLLCKIQPRWL